MVNETRKKLRKILTILFLPVLERKMGPLRANLQRGLLLQPPHPHQETSKGQVPS